MSLKDKLEKIKSPNLQNQQHTAVILSVVEETLANENTDLTPTAYFAALLALLRDNTSDSQNTELTSSIVYLLDVVSASVPAPLLRSQFTTILSYLVPILTDSETSPSISRSSIGCLESLLRAQNAVAWSLPPSQASPRKALSILLALATDPRPKVRKRSLESLSQLLKAPPRRPSLDHPAANLCAASALNNLQRAIEAAGQVRKQRRQEEERHDPHVLHALHMVKTIAIASRGWPSKNIEPLCESLLGISRSTNDFLVMAAFEVFEVIFENMQDEVSSTKLSRMLEAIEELQPAKNDSQLLPPWIAVLSRGYEVSAQIEPDETLIKLPDLFDRISAFLTSPAHNIRVSASECLVSFLMNGIPSSVFLEPSIYDEKVLGSLGVKATGLLSMKYRGAWMEVFKVLIGFLDSFRWRGNPYLHDVVKIIGDLRGNDSFQGRKQADEVLAHAISNLGPEATLEILPLNLAAPAVGQPGRAWLLPLLRDNVSNASLQHFKKELVPLSQLMYQRTIDHGEQEKTMEIKIYETVVHQIWATLPAYCDLPLDLREGLDQPFGELIANLLYKQTDLRPDVCRALQNLVETYQAVMSDEFPEEELRVDVRMSKADAQKNIDHVASFANNFLAVLFNVYSQALPQHRGYILQCINAYLGITPEKELVLTFTRVKGLFECSLTAALSQQHSNHKKASKDTLPPESHTLLDLLIALSSHLPMSSLPQLSDLASRTITTPDQDPQLIKKAYRLISRLVSTDTGIAAPQVQHSKLQSLLLQTANITPPAARYPRLLALNSLIFTLPMTDLHFIPSILSEVVLACRSTSDKARQTAFNILIRAAEVITNAPLGSVIHNSQIPGMPSSAPDAPPTIEEVFTMVSAGLAGGAPSVVAATCTALGRLLFEFHKILSAQVLGDLVDTVAMFLESNSREIVRAVLGFVKVALVVLPDEVLRPKGSDLVREIVPWCKEHKGRLRAKVKGILERAIRRWGTEKCEKWVMMAESGGDDGRKLVRSIRKERERRKKKKSAKEEGGEGGGDEDGKAGQGDFDNEFDKAVYGSDDDDDLSDLASDGGGNDVDTVAVSFRNKRSPRNGYGKNAKGQFIREDLLDDDDDDATDPLDLLAPEAMARISSRKTFVVDRKSRTTKARVNEDGKLVFGDADSAVMADGGDPANDRGGGVDAYVEAVSGPDAVRRGQKGRLKVKQQQQQQQQRGHVDPDQGRDQDRMDVDHNQNQSTDDVRKEAAKLLMRSEAQRQKQAPRMTKRRGLGVEKSRGGSSADGIKKRQTVVGKGRVAKKNARMRNFSGYGNKHGTGRRG